ncbi:uncharacterized protein LOC112848317 [Oreochromis niloticus]|uniref:uncharacterized protein LOC112848317 n=1 Tax=Oreochromis niloticus TaxID=8128 RepID=UPI000DF1CCC0|nr:uncharacterized protein LOC112848317 [Oreochromis niloticus]
MTFTSNHLEICKGTLLGDHYKVEGFLEEGGFGIVTKCRNTKTNKVVAIKVNKSDPEILQQAKMEIYILEKLRSLDADRCNIVKWNDFFIDGDRICLNFELLDESLWRYMRYRGNRVLPVREIRPVLFQLANALSHLGSLGIVHADLKPGNIMVVDRYECPIKVKLIHFGFACPASTVIPGDCVGTVGYRAPEVMIGSLFNEAIDMWSLGLVAVELATGFPFYPGRNDYDVLKFIIQTQGQPPYHVLDSGLYTDNYFINNNYNGQRWTFKTERQFQDETGYQSKDTRCIRLKCLDDLEQLLKIRGCWEKIQNVFVSLIKRMLALDPNQRITPSEVLHHPFFNPGLSKSSPCTDMSSTGGQNLVVSQQPSSCKRERTQKISCSSQNSEEFSQQEYVNASANTSSSKDDLEISKGTLLGDHYEVEGFLGEGRFGIVTKCRNTKTNEFVAIKVNKKEPKILQQAKMEIFILEQLRGLDADRCNIVQWNDFFVEGHSICLNFELLDQSLWQYMRDRGNRVLPIGAIRAVLFQLANALSHLGSLGMVHADLKPRNIMVVDRYECPIKVKLIDFGFACPASTVIPGDCVGTVGYRAPEVVIGSLFNEAIDMWSLGQVAVELATGVPFYPGRNDYDVLKFIIQTQGQPPDHVLDSGLYTDNYFIKDNYNGQRWTFKTERQFQDETGYQSKDTRCIRLKCLDDLEQLLRGCRRTENSQHLFFSLIKQMLALDPKQRITPSEVLHHTFFSPAFSKSSPCTDMSSTGGQNLVVSQQPSSCKREESQKISCSSQNSEEFSQQEYVNASANTSSSKDDLEISKGTLLGDHYEVEGFLGEGGFGIVTKCRNTKTNEFVAIKVNKRNPEILQQAKKEILILEHLRGLDADRCNIVQWNGFFLDHQRICLNFELLDQCLWDYIEDRKNQGLPISEVRPILHQLTNALSHLGSLGIVHADLKPGNIMVVNRHKCPIKVKLIDFGFACPVSKVNPGGCEGTVGYRAPEVVIGSRYNEAIDMWSLGLVAVELATGVPFYPGKNDYDVLKFIIQTQGQPPDHVLDSGLYTDNYFIKDNYNGQRWTFKTERQFQDETDYQSKDTRYIRLKCLDDLKQLLKIRGCWEKIQNVFVSLIKRMLALDPNQRITPSEVLHHPFFNPGLSKSSPCTDMSSTGGQNLVVSQQPSSCKRERTQKISCSSQNSEEFSQQEYVNASANTSSSKDDLEISKGTLLGDHYEVEGFLGEGRFGIVTKCRNTKTNEFVAIKVIKKEPKILQQAEKEILILMLLRGLDADRWNIVQWNDFFVEGHSICLNFELLDQSLWQYMRDRGNRVLPIGAIRAVLFQLANALSHLGSLGMVHADLKPRNIMVVDRYECPIKVKLIDFGFACPASTVIPGDCVGTVGYRAPEVMIGSLFNEAIDMWSLGLVAVELATGFPFYPGRNDYDVLKFIIQTQGQPPDHVLDSGLYTDNYFINDNYNGQRWTFKTERQFQDETGYQSKDTRCIRLKCLDDLEQLLRGCRRTENSQHLFFSLIKQMLALDPNQRITPSEVLHHPFFNPGLSKSSP